MTAWPAISVEALFSDFSVCTAILPSFSSKRRARTALCVSGTFAELLEVSGESFSSLLPGGLSLLDSDSVMSLESPGSPGDSPPLPIFWDKLLAVSERDSSVKEESGDVESDDTML